MLYGLHSHKKKAPNNSPLFIFTVPYYFNVRKCFKIHINFISFKYARNTQKIFIYEITQTNKFIKIIHDKSYCSRCCVARLHNKTRA